jgi:hypothetical protein
MPRTVVVTCVVVCLPPMPIRLVVVVVTLVSDTTSRVVSRVKVHVVDAVKRRLTAAPPADQPTSVRSASGVSPTRCSAVSADATEADICASARWNLSTYV